jgi:sugar/nucleoside kinase (ribokinase family)
VLFLYHMKNPQNPSQEFDVIVVGELNVDLIFNKIEMFPETGKEVLAGQMVLTLGSSSAIFASNLSSMGSKVVFTGMVGHDIFGDFVLKSLEDKKVNTRFLIKSDQFNTGATVVINQAEDRAMLTYPGAMTNLMADHISDSMLGSAGHLHVSSIFLQPELKKGISGLMRRAKNSGMTTSLDTQWDPEEQWDLPLQELLPLVDVFLPNRQEFLNLSNSTNMDDGIEKLAPWLNVLVIKDGNKGASLWHKGSSLNQPAFLNPEVADAIGAGDSFDAGFIHRYIQKYPMDDCLRYAALMGAINTTKPGGTAAFSDGQAIRKIAQERFRMDI